MKTISILGALIISLVLTTGSFAKTPDKLTPSVETICDVFAESTGPAFGLCNAYCEAMDCGDPLVHASTTACGRISDNFEKLTGFTLPGGGYVEYDGEGEIINNCDLEQE